MIRLAALFFYLIIPATSVAQTTYYNFDFEKTDTTGKNLVEWQGENRGVEFYVDTTGAASGKNSLYTNIRNPQYNDPASYYMILPKSYYVGMRSISISVKILMRGTSAYTGLWCKVKKGRDLIGHASTYKGPIPFPTFSYIATTGTNLPVTPYKWEPYNFEIKTQEDPTEVMVGLFLRYDRAWFDNIEIKINDKIIDNIVFKLSDME